VRQPVFIIPGWSDLPQTGSIFSSRSSLRICLGLDSIGRHGP
jgi:hypothetical protein